MASMFIKRPGKNKTEKDLRKLELELQQKNDDLLAMQEMIASLYESKVS